MFSNEDIPFIYGTRGIIAELHHYFNLAVVLLILLLLLLFALLLLLLLPLLLLRRPYSPILTFASLMDFSKSALFF